MFLTCYDPVAASCSQGSEDGLVYTWDLVSAKQLGSFRAHSRGVASLSCHPKLTAFLTSSYDGSIKYWADDPLMSSEVQQS